MLPSVQQRCGLNKFYGLEPAFSHPGFSSVLGIAELSQEGALKQRRLRALGSSEKYSVKEVLPENREPGKGLAEEMAMGVFRQKHGCDCGQRCRSAGQGRGDSLDSDGHRTCWKALRAPHCFVSDGANWGRRSMSFASCRRGFSELWVLHSPGERNPSRGSASPELLLLQFPLGRGELIAVLGEESQQ